jgi:hypothetical protein
MREAVKNFDSLLRHHQVRMVFNAGSAGTNAEFQSMGGAIAV